MSWNLTSYYCWTRVFFNASHLGTVVASVRIHAHYSHHPCTNKPTTTLRSEDRVLLEITEIPSFRRRRACHDPFLASRVRGRCLKPVKRGLFLLGCCTALTRCDTSVVIAGDRTLVGRLATASATTEPLARSLPDTSCFNFYE
jgi:hypothetical protein